MEEYTIGSKIKCRVSAIETYGVFVTVSDNYSGLIHISEICNGFVKDVNKFFKVGDVIYAEILEVDSVNCRLRLSVKSTLQHSYSHKSKVRLVETPLGFKTLSYNLPIWIDKKIEKIEKEKNSIDK